VFSFLSPQSIHFGRGQHQQAATIAKGFGHTALLVHGANAARTDWLVQQCHDAGLTLETIACRSEPSLPDIEQALAALGGFCPTVVIALGGGSVMDLAKALAALVPCSGPPRDYLEVVGKGRPLDAAPIPVIALPTTAGTGAEVTKNAVISVPDCGLKVSLRDPRMIPQVAIVDAQLMQGAPQRVTLSAGLDAVTQVIEPYLSCKSNPMTDAICRAAIPVGISVLRDVVEQGTDAAWDAMAWVSACGGLALANAGLGAVHGFAGVIGGKTGAPHGEICGALLPEVLQSHLRKSQKGTDIHERVHWVQGQIDAHFANGATGQGIAALKEWSAAQGLPSLAALGVSAADHDGIASAAASSSSMKGNPFTLSQMELVGILQATANWGEQPQT